MICPTSSLDEEEVAVLLLGLLQGGTVQRSYKIKHNYYNVCYVDLI